MSMQGLIMSNNTNLLTIEDYFQTENSNLTKNEFMGGCVFPVELGDVTHNLIKTNLMFEIMSNIRGKKYQTFVGDTKLWITDHKTNTEVIYYPDLMVCINQSDSKNYVTDPILIIEIASESTSRQDRNEKIKYYSCIDSLIEYVVIDQRTKKIDRYSMDTDKQDIENIPKKMSLTSINSTIDIKHIYDGINF